MSPETYKETRESIGTQAEVAAFLGVTRGTIAKRETGTVEINREAELALSMLAKIPKARRTPES
jgi:DNA-binding XRE family transcriptional regulator